MREEGKKKKKKASKYCQSLLLAIVNKKRVQEEECLVLYHSNIVPHLARSTTSEESPHSSRSAQMTYKYSVIFVRLLFPNTLPERNAFACVNASVCVGDVPRVFSPGENRDDGSAGSICGAAS